MPRVKSAAPRPALPDRPTWWRLVWRRQRGKLRSVIAGAALLAGVVVLVIAVRVVGAGTNFSDRAADATARLGLRIQTIVVEGRTKTPEDQLRATLGVHAGDPILAFSVAGARSRLEAINWVKSASVERRLPGTIIVRLNERTPFAVWQLEGKFVLIDREGNVVADSDVAAFAGQLPLVVGAGAPKAASLLLDALAGQPELLGRLVAAVRVGERRWNLRMKNGADVLLPEGAEVQALAKLAELQASSALLDRPLQSVDLRLPDRLVVRPVAEPVRPVAPTSSRKPT